MEYKNAFNFKNKTILITGGGGGIGREFARAFTECGGITLIADLFLKKAKKVSDEMIHLGGISFPIQADISNIESIQVMIKKVLEKFGKIDVLLNHAGVDIRKAAIEFTEEDWDKIMNVNLKGAFFMAQEVGKQMIRQKKGKIINTASVSSVRGHPNLAIYSASKGGIIQLTKVLANEWAQYHINVNALGPGYVLTSQTRSLLDDKERYYSVLSKIPLGRLGVPADMAGTALFLASELSNYITGQVIYIEGGRLID